MDHKSPTPSISIHQQHCIIIVIIRANVTLFKSNQQQQQQQQQQQPQPQQPQQQQPQQQQPQRGFSLQVGSGVCGFVGLFALTLHLSTL
jgi:hypothetical protein